MWCGSWESSPAPFRPGRAGGTGTCRNPWGEGPAVGRAAARAPRTGSAFTLVELLVVVAIAGLLVAILVPSLGQAREQARSAACRSHLRQIGLAVAAYASMSQGIIPFGPTVEALAPFLPANDGTQATNQIWTGPQPPARRHMALGLLLPWALVFPEQLYCPSDDSDDPREELAQLRTRPFAPVYSSFLYRQLDESDGVGRLDRLGRNSLGGRAVALALDMNAVITFDPAWFRTNHRAQRVNILYADSSVQNFDNTGHPFSLRDQDLPGIAGRLDRILQTADGGYHRRHPSGTSR